MYLIFNVYLNKEYKIEKKIIYINIKDITFIKLLILIKKMCKLYYKYLLYKKNLKSHIITEIYI